MPVLINYKICDNAKECDGIRACPTGAMFWNEERETVDIDNSKCTECGRCEEACMVNAISVAQTEDEYEKLKEKIENDPRKKSDLFVERYGAEPINEDRLVGDNFQSEVIESGKFTAVEFFSGDSIMCLKSSIPITDLFDERNIEFMRQEITEDKKSLMERFDVEELPSLLFFNNGELLGKIEGYYRVKDRKSVKKKIDNILSC